MKTIIAVVLLLVCTACSAQGTERSSERVEADRVLLVKSYRFQPADIEVRAGTAVTWTNQDDFVHNVHLLDDDITKDLPIGGTASITFEEAGTVRYECSLHPSQMKGSILVTEA